MEYQLANSLPSKTVALRGPAARQHRKNKRSTGKKRKVPPTLATPESTQPASKKARVEDGGDDDERGPSLSATASMQLDGIKVKVCELAVTYVMLINSIWISKESGKRNPIYLFYEMVSKNAEGLTGKPGDKHYKCYHGNRKVLTITRAMRSSLNGNLFEFAPILLLILFISLKA